MAKRDKTLLAQIEEDVLDDQRSLAGALRKNNSSRRPVFYVYKRKTNP